MSSETDTPRAIFADQLEAGATFAKTDQPDARYVAVEIRRDAEMIHVIGHHDDPLGGPFGGSFGKNRPLLVW